MRKLGSLPVTARPRSLMKKLERHHDIMYGIGVEDGHNGYGMMHGPFKNIEDAFDIIGSSDKDTLIRFNADGTHDALYQWNDAELLWVRK